MVIVVANLLPRQMKFGLSEGMVTAAGRRRPEVFLLSPDSGAKPAPGCISSVGFSPRVKINDQRIRAGDVSTGFLFNETREKTSTLRSLRRHMITSKSVTIKLVDGHWMLMISNFSGIVCMSVASSASTKSLLSLRPAPVALR